MWDDFSEWIDSLLGGESTREWDWNDILYEIEDEDEFEVLVKDLWEDMGFEASWTGPGTDGGVDVVAEKSGVVGLNSVKIVIEAKWYQDGNAVSRPRVQKLEGARSGRNADKAVLVTSSTFANPAKEYEKQLDHLEVMNGREFIDKLNKSSLEPPQVEFHC